MAKTVKLNMQAAGGAEGKTDTLEIPKLYDFILNADDKRYRFAFDTEGNIEILFINGVKGEIICRQGCPGIKLAYKY